MVAAGFRRYEFHDSRHFAPSGPSELEGRVFLDEVFLP
jgi:hypothetical protein